VWNSRSWLLTAFAVAVLAEVASLNGSNVCMVKQK
jgi:hypothetical protein